MTESTETSDTVAHDGMQALELRRGRTRAFLLETRLIAIVRVKNPVDFAGIAQALHAGGIHAIEFTLNSPGALDAIRDATALLGDTALIGAGTVLTPMEAHAAAGAGAQFLVTPVTDRAVIETAHSRGCAIVPGAYTPTELAYAQSLGADLVKLFPAGGLGPTYVRDVLAPLGHLKLVPTGGVTPENTSAFLDAGAAALAIGTGVCRAEWAINGNFEAIGSAARSFRVAVDAWRKGHEE